VLLDRTFPGVMANFVGVDDEEAGRLAVEHLIEQGCARIAHIRGPEVSTALGRLAGYRQTLAKHGLAERPEYIVRGTSGDDGADSSGYVVMGRLLQLDPRPDAVFCYNDPIAMGAMKAILEARLRVPEDVAVVGCGNVNYAGSLRVPLSSIDQSSGAIGERAAKLALSLIESKGTVKPRSVLLRPELVVRDSSRKRGPIASKEESPVAAR
jgi:LacI family transcriptional regulator